MVYETNTVMAYCMQWWSFIHCPRFYSFRGEKPQERPHLNNRELARIFAATGAKHGYDSIKAEFAAFNDFKVRWTRSFKWAEFEVSDYLMDAPEVIMKKFKRAVTDCETAVKYDKENKAGISNLLTIYCAATGKTLAEAEAEFAGQGYGVFKPAVGEAVVELLRPLREESERIMKDKAYLESVYKEGAEHAAYLAQKTLSKVYRKIGFVAK